jgi:hypothetical protein
VKAMTNEESLRVDDMHANEFLKQAYRKAAMYELTINEAREEFMTVVYNELSDDSDNCRANRIIDAADEYVEEVIRLERESNDA